MISINEWDGTFPKKHNTESCKGNISHGVCERCGAYFVFKETYDLKLKDQPYMK